MSEPERTFSDEEAADILRRAAASDAAYGPLPARDATRFSLRELQQIAAEARIDPARVAEAAAQQPVPDLVGRVAGTPTLLSTTYQVPAPLASRHAALLTTIRTAMQQDGRATTAPGLLEWRSANEMPDVRIRIVEDGRTADTTEISIRMNLRSTLLFAMMMPATAGTLAAMIIAGSVLQLPASADVLGATAAAGTAAAVSGWAAWRTRARRWHHRIDALLRDLTGTLTAPAGSVPSPESPPPAPGTLSGDVAI